MEQNYIDKELEKFDMSDVIIAELQNKFMAMKVESPEDKENYDVCVEAHKIMKKKLAAIETIRVDLKDESLNYGRKVDARAKKWSIPVKGIVVHLGEQRKVVEDEEKRKKEEKENLARAELERLEQEELDRLAKQKAEQDEKDRQIKAEQDRLDEERRKFEEEKRIDKENKEREAREKIEAEEAKVRAEQYEKDKAEREAKAKEDMEAEKYAEAKRKESLKPDKEKLAKLARDIREIDIPEVKTNEAYVIADEAECSLLRAANNIEKAI